MAGSCTKRATELFETKEEAISYYEKEEKKQMPEGMTDEDKISDYLSDQTGFCHKGFQLEELTGAIPEAEAKKLIENGEAVLYSSYPIAIQRKEG